MKPQILHKFSKKKKVKFHEKFVKWEPNCFMRTDVANVTVPFRNFPNASKMIRKTNVACSERRHPLQV